MAQMEGANARNLQQRITNGCGYQTIKHLTSGVKIANDYVCIRLKKSKVLPSSCLSLVEGPVGSKGKFGTI